MKVILLSAAMLSAIVGFAQTQEKNESKKVVTKKIEIKTGETDGNTNVEVKDGKVYITTSEGTKVMDLEELKNSGNSNIEISDSNMHIRVIRTKEGENMDWETKVGEHFNLDSLKASGKVIMFNMEDENTNGEIRKEIRIQHGKDGDVKILKFEGDEVENLDIEAILKENGIDLEELKKSGKGEVVTKSIFIRVELGDVKTEEIKQANKQGAKLLENAQELSVSDFSMAPNPSTTGNFTLDFTIEEKGKLDITVYSIEGKQVYSESISDFRGGNLRRSIQLEDGSKGTYLVQIRQGKKAITKKLVVG